MKRSGSAFVTAEGIESPIERVDDLPVRFGLPKEMGSQAIVGRVIRRHGDWEGLSPGWVVTL
jgi:hypothetical protein